MSYELVAVGVSAGGLHALCTLIRSLPDEFDMAMAIVQHRSPASEYLGELLQDCTRLPVREVEDKEPICPGHLYLAPPDYHLLVEPGHFTLSKEEPVRWSRPSIDVMFESAADAYGRGAIGMVLTGANSDGARGLRRIVDAGGYAIVQDPKTAEVPTMPVAALHEVENAQVLPLEEMASCLARLARDPQEARP